jgi:hypothetical protein
MPTGVSQSSGPKGDFYMKFKYKDGSNQAFQDALANGGQASKVVPWNEAGPAGKDYPTYDWTTGYTSNTTYYSGLAPPTNYQPGAPDANLLQLKDVELPDCKDDKHYPDCKGPTIPRVFAQKNGIDMQNCIGDPYYHDCKGGSVPTKAYTQKNGIEVPDLECKGSDPMFRDCKASIPTKAYAQASSDELPDCMDEKADKSVPLNKERTNKIKATCKLYPKKYRTDKNVPLTMAQ